MWLEGKGGNEAEGLEWAVRREGVLVKRTGADFIGGREGEIDGGEEGTKKRPPVARRHVRDLGLIWLAPPVKHDVIASSLSQLSTLIWDGLGLSSKREGVLIHVPSVVR